jgi:hypothetical protein
VKGEGFAGWPGVNMVGEGRTGGLGVDVEGLVEDVKDE